jgi:hypothetical protein
LEKKWDPIVPHTERMPVDQRDPEKVYDHTFDALMVKRGIISDFEDQGEKMN